MIRGAVQGVGFRPFIFRLATGLNLAGEVSNNSQGVVIDVEGAPEQLQDFLLRIDREKPPHASIQSLEPSWLDPAGYSEFVIRESSAVGPKSALVLPDLATCPDCVADIFEPGNRRHLYPFTNCTNCGPRFSIIESLPYDRANTSMKQFVMCPDCRREYEDPRNRRFHAQPNACPVCGPRVELWDKSGNRKASDLYAMLDAVEEIRNGRIVAVKGLGGFHLFADARNEDTIARLRERKHREEKPFALMYPDLGSVREDCTVSGAEERLLRSSESPIVLLRRREETEKIRAGITLQRLAGNVAPENPWLGVMLPYTPLHHILLREFRGPVVATSGNLTDEPICTDEREALVRLGSIADVLLVHNRPIVRHVDDSIVRVMLGRELVLRRARGYAPLPITITASPNRPVIAVGAHLKNTVAICRDSNVFVSQHIGDLETMESFNAFKNVTRDLANLYELENPEYACDMHPDYVSSKAAHATGSGVFKVQHHYAHVAACMAENHIDGPLLGVSWDGTGYGPDGTIWGGEFLITTGNSFRRLGSFAQFRLPGGDLAAKEPRRSALGVLYQMFGPDLFSLRDVAPLESFGFAERHILNQMLLQGVNSPWTSSVGRLFDAVASLMGLCQRANFEGQAAMRLEFLTTGTAVDESYPFEVVDSGEAPGLLTVDWRPLVRGILSDLKVPGDLALISVKFHNTLAAIVLAVANNAQMERVVLTGGCFQNVYLTERCVGILREHGFKPYWHQRIPPNDGGISLGQVYALARHRKDKTARVAASHYEEVAS
ncbi:MAG TPA: carbamoyltransferase HypF [Bacteroidota bacterium]|nr:carbamoyltransferase HypF [Bacteroidota bacterium]